MDGLSGYNQIKMAPEDMEKTTFVTQWGTFCYKVMPFGLKNVGATYQHAMVALFYDVVPQNLPSFHTRIVLVLWLWNKGIFIKLRQVTSDVYFANGCSQSIFRAEDRFVVLQRFGVQRFTSPTQSVIFRCSFVKKIGRAHV